MSNDEPLEEWAARRERRLRPVGERKAVHLTGPPRASHVDREAPRVVLEWDGYQWVTLAVAANYLEAARLVYPSSREGVGGGGTTAAHRTRPAPYLGEGTGRHRRTT
ncbi:DUF6087 family protein [Embleya hyalina]|uniref:Uncharacterized protein n=1 Tax=Embleya hyalina TaxID=516124 RepID=A0A401YLL7_9ACTN|nr:DUF6087 family protein [Embleya hyalina]GCD95512.1 hypothetical protein EHYA_03186 [Embleya hyalina]